MASEPRITYSDAIPSADAYLSLFETTRWNDFYKQAADVLHQALSNSWYVVSAYHGEELVGTGRLVSDGVQYAVVFDMIVAPGFQGHGIGGEILTRLLERCAEAEVRDVLLFSADGKKDFYAKRGFEVRPENAPGMILRRRV